MQPVIAATLTELGFNVTQILTGSDWSETSTIINEGTFDLLMWAQNTLPAGDPAWFLNNFFRSEGGSNMAHLNSSTVDSLLDELDGLSDHTERVAATADAHAAILAEFPVSNLVTPAWHVSDWVPNGSERIMLLHQ